MKIIKNERKGNLIELEVEVAADQVAIEQKKTFAAAAREVKLPGFRPGKAPLHLVERALDMAQIAARSVQDLIYDLYPQVLKEAKIDPIDYPNLAIVSAENGKLLVFSVKVEVYPEVKLGKYKNIEVTRKSTAVEESDIEKVLGSLQSRFARFEDKGAEAAATGDLLELDVEAKEGDQAFVPLTGKNIKMVIGDAFFAHEFDQQLVGVCSGESKNFLVSFPADHYIQEATGKTIDFYVTVKKVSRKENLPLDDEFAKQVGKFGNLAELRDQIKANLEIEKKQDSDADFNNQLIEAVVKTSSVDAPRALVNREVEIMLDELRHSLSRSNLTLEAYLKSLRKDESQMKDEFYAPAKSRVEAKILLREIAKAEGLQVTAEEIEMELSKMAVSAGKTLSEFKSSLSDGGFAFVEDYLLRQKGLDLIIREAKVNA